MKARTIAFVVIMSLVGAIYVVGSHCTGQGKFGDEFPYRPFLIDDLPKPPVNGAARFQILTSLTHTFLLDTQSGDAWILSSDMEQKEKLCWIKVPRYSESRDGKASKESKEPAEKPETIEDANSDPFK